MSGVSINWFEIPVADEARAAKFYAEALGIELGEMQGPEGRPMKVFMNGEMPSGALIKGEGNAPSATGPLVYLNAPDLNGVVSRTEKAGGKVVMPKTDIGPHGQIAMIVDSEGNRIGLHSA